MSLSCWPEGYGYTFTRPVNWDEGAMTQEDARLLSKEHSRRNYVVVWEGRDEKVAFRNGVQQWRAAAARPAGQLEDALAKGKKALA